MAVLKLYRRLSGSFWVFMFIAQLSFGQDTLQVFFPLNSCRIEVNIIDSINKWITDKRLRPEQKLTILGYTDLAGEGGYNDRLSLMRAKSIREYLDTKGFINDNSIVCIGKGPISHPGKNAWSNPFDRKVQIITTGKPQNGSRHVLPVTMLADTQYVVDNLAVNDVFPLDHVLFELGSAEMLPGSFPELNGIAGFMQHNPEVKICIEGHICRCNWTGSSKGGNDTSVTGTSFRRAFAVHKYLVAKGIDKMRISCAGLGDMQPFVAIERSEADEALNRRVSVRILHK